MTRGRSRVASVATALILTPLAGCSAESPASAPGSSGRPVDVSAPSSTIGSVDEQFDEQFEALERRRHGRLGVFALDTGSGKSVAYRADERFALASTVKVLTAAVLLERLSTRDLERRVRWAEADLVDYSPITEMFVDDGMTIRQLIDASLTMSDNTAANLLFDQVGGPQVVQERLVEMGDRVTSVDRMEPDLNDWAPGETRDTSTPRALASTFDSLVRGDLLAAEDRRVLKEELGDSLTGAKLVRAAVPDGFVVGDKSGTAAYGTRNDLAIVRPPGRAPWIVAVMTSHESADAATDDGLVAAATRIVVKALRVQD
jgi:beta-lactamase class A